MFGDKLIKKFLPLTEAWYYILLSLVDIRHGYGIMQHVETISAGRVKIGPGTLYGAISKMEKEGLIEMVLDDDKRKSYALTGEGRMILYYEIKRLKELLDNGELVFKDIQEGI